jgi:hypothetical protein
LILCYGLMVVSAIASGAGATTIIVRPDGTGDFPTIQAAIDAAQDGDVIELTDGTFMGNGNRDIDYLGKAITVRSQSGDPETCIIDCEGVARGIDCSNVGSGAGLEGVTITGGEADLGGAMYGASSIEVTDCIFYRNHSTIHGGAVHASDSGTPRYVGCRFIENSAASFGGAFLSGYSGTGACSPTFEDCIFSGNTAACAGGVNVSTGHMGTIVFAGCTFANNAAGAGGGMWIVQTTANITGCTLWGNADTQDFAGGIYLYNCESTIDNTIVAFSTAGCGVSSDGGTPTLSCCDIYDNAGGDWVGSIAGQLGQNGNISEDPLFCDPENGDFTLHEDSPCAPFTPPNEECDLIGARPVGCGPTVVRMGTWGAIKALYRR